jgi:hypothetical protein
MTNLTPRLYLLQLLESLPADSRPWEDHLGVIYRIASTALLAGIHSQLSYHVETGLTIVVHLPTGAICWRRPIGDIHITSAPDNTDRIRAYLAPERDETR